jgi:superfamily II DNA or RNA helicase
MNREDIQNEVLAKLLTVNRGTAAVSGGVGKTLIGLRHMNNIFNAGLSDKFLVVAPKKSIFQSWKDDAKKFRDRLKKDGIKARLKNRSC